MIQCPSCQQFNQAPPVPTGVEKADSVLFKCLHCGFEFKSDENSPTIAENPFPKGKVLLG